MPIQITDQSFQRQSFAPVTNQYVANAGDEITVTFSIRTQMRISSVSNPMSLDPSLNQITSPAISWLDEGFRVDNWLLVTIFTSGGSVAHKFFTKVEFVDDQILDVTSLPHWYDNTNGEIIEFYVLNWNGSVPPATGYVEPRKYDELDVLINNCLSGQQGSSLSLIDGENSRAIFTDLDGQSVGTQVAGVLVGNQSGQFFNSCVLYRNNNTNDDFVSYTLLINFVQSGMYDESWFATNSHLKFYTRLVWRALSNDPYPPSVIEYDGNANTGWFNEPHEVSTTNSVLLQGVQELDYCVPSVHTIQIQTDTISAIQVGYGGCYVSIDDAYYKNKPYNQFGITMLVPTTNLAVVQMTSNTNVDGAGYQITLNDVDFVNGILNITFTFTPNAQFNTFMANRQDGDRLFYLWISDDNVNHAVFAGQLKCDPPVGGVLGLSTNYGFLDHGQNIDVIAGSKSGFVANTEDDCAWYGTFLLDNNQVYDSLNCQIEAFNGTAQDDFTLQSTTFSFGGIQISNAGIYLINETQPIISTLPSNSAKLNALFQRVPSMDTATQYGVSVYYPFLLNWQYWLQQLNASVDFYPTQNKNWEQYDDLPDWELRFKITMVKDGLAFENFNVIRDLPYDSSTVIDQTIDLFIESTGQIVQVVAIGEQMRVVATHTINNGQTWDPNDTWGMITVEPKESTPRTICSSVLPFDNDLTNPLTPINGTQMVITYPAPNIAKMECFFNPDIIDLSNGCKFTTKIKGCPTAENTDIKKTTDGLIKTTTSGDNKTLAV